MERKGFELGGGSQQFPPRAPYPGFYPIAQRLDTSRSKTCPGTWYARLTVEGTVVAPGAFILLPLLWQPLDLLEVFDVLVARGGLCYPSSQHTSAASDGYSIG